MQTSSSSPPALQSRCTYAVCLSACWPACAELQLT